MPAGEKVVHGPLRLLLWRNNDIFSKAVHVLKWHLHKSCLNYSYGRTHHETIIKHISPGMLARASSFNLPHTRSTLSLVTNQHHSRTLTYGSCALLRWPSPQHGMKGTRAGRKGWPSHRLPCQAAASIQPRSMAVLRAHTCSDHQDAAAMKGSLMEEWAEHWCFHTSAYFCPPALRMHAKSPLVPKLTGLTKSQSDAPSSSSSPTHLQNVAAECPHVDNEEHFWACRLPNPKS